MTGCLCAGYNPGTILRTTKDSGNRQILLIRFAAVVKIHHPGANLEKETVLLMGDLCVERSADRNHSVKMSTFTGKVIKRDNGGNVLTPV